MQIRKRSREIQDPSESGALNDLAFLLIIYFIVIAGFQVHQGFLLNLPEQGRATWVNTEDLLRVNLDAQGQILVQGQVLSLEELEEGVRELKAQRPDMTFQLRINPETPYQYVVDLIALVHRLRVDNFSFSLEGEGVTASGGTNASASSPASGGSRP